MRIRGASFRPVVDLEAEACTVLVMRQMLHIHILLATPLRACHMTQTGANQHAGRMSIRKHTNYAWSAPDLAVQTSNHIVGADIRPVRRREIHIG